MVLRLAWMTASLVLSSSLARAQEGPTEAELQQRVDAQIELYEDAFGRWAMESRTIREADEAFLARRPKVSDFAGPIWEVAQGHPRTAVARSALLWLHARLEHDDRENRSRALDLILSHHVAHESMGELCMRLSYEDAEQSLAALRTFFAKSPHRSVRGLACYGLGRALARDPQRHAQAEALLERARTEFGGVSWGVAGMPTRKLSSKAAADLYELRNLQVGMQAPDIEGSDVEGVAFKLSDYAAKVILLDFWGFW